MPTVFGAGSKQVPGLYGDGSDGAVTIGANTTLTRDMFYTTLTVSTTFALTTASYRVFASQSITTNGTGTIRNNGNAASGATGGAALANGTLFGNTAAGPNGGTGAGTAGTNVTVTYGGAGGAGGASGGNGGGAGGTVTAPAATSGSLRGGSLMLVGAIGGQNTYSGLNVGAGGGAGGGDGTNSGGGGGGGGGSIILCSPVVVNNGTITATGGAGGAGVAGNAGGGGGGGGGWIVVISDQFSGATPTAAGGALGAGVGTGVNGVAGSAGLVLQP